jgi:tRNA pseudouridine38-40 synthase
VVGELETKRFGVLLEVAYDGKEFHGWAAQRGARTVEEVLAGAIQAMDDGASQPRGASRTDAGVHAEAQLAAFDATREIATRGWALGLNQHLPADVSVRSARTVPVGFSPRFAARAKRYRYRLLPDALRDPRWRDRAWRVGEGLDLDKLARELATAEGTHDFAAFRASKDERKDTVRTLTRVAVERESLRVVGVVVVGNAFLYNMVRILVGTAVDVAQGRLEEGAITRAIASGDRRLAGTTAPAHGLTLETIELDPSVEAGEPWPR